MTIELTNDGNFQYQALKFNFKIDLSGRFSRQIFIDLTVRDTTAASHRIQPAGSKETVRNVCSELKFHDRGRGERYKQRYSSIAFATHFLGATVAELSRLTFEVRK